MGQREKLGAFLAEVANWKWDEFARSEKDPQYSTNQAIIFALVRACSMEKLDAIKLSLNRLDGKLKTPVKIEFPKIFYLFPNAKPVEPTKKLMDEGDIGQDIEILEGDIEVPATVPEPEPQKGDLPSMGLRETLSRMSDFPRNVPEAIIKRAQLAEQHVRGQIPRPPDDEIPLVKSVVAAHLLKMAQDRNMEAITEVFDQIDGKLLETIQVIGEDIYISDYSLLAPEGAYLNKDGIMQIEATQAQNLWAQKLGQLDKSNR